MNIDPATILALITELYATSLAQQRRIAQLEAQLDADRPSR